MRRRGRGPEDATAFDWAADDLPAAPASGERPGVLPARQPGFGGHVDAGAGARAAGRARPAEHIGDAPGLAVLGADGYRWMTDPDAGIARRDGTIEFVI
jgi:hypothetical protein